MNKQKARKNPENLYQDISLQGTEKDGARAPGLGFAPISDRGNPIVAERQRACNPIRAYGLHALRIALLAGVFAVTPLLMNHGQGHARVFESTSAAPIAGGSLPGATERERAEKIFDLASGFAVEKQLMSLPDVKAQPPESPPSQSDKPAQPAAPAARPLSEIDQYLWSVYQRSGTKRDSSGDFTWKDEAAAARRGLFTEEYVIGGMDPDFRELLYDLGHAMDADGINWTILSAFRDDYRQSLAAGYKAHGGNSFHGGSIATGGYGHGCAADLAATDGSDSDSNSMLWKWLDRHGEQFRIHRPMREADPAHVQPFGAWHEVAGELRDKRVEISHADLPSGTAQTAVVSPAVASRSGVSEAQFNCVRSYHHFEELRTARLFSHHRTHMARVFRHGRWRMLADIGEPQKHPGAEASPNTEETHRNAKPPTAADITSAEKRPASEHLPNTEESHHNAKLRTAADISSAEKRPASEHLSNTEETHHNANLRRVADMREPEKHPAAEHLLNAERGHRNGKWRKLADIRSLQRRSSAEALRHHVRSRGHLHFVGRIFDSARGRT